MAAKIKFVNKDKTQFFNVLQGRVNQYFTDNHLSVHANGMMVFKTVFMLALYFVPYILIVTDTVHHWMWVMCWAIMGLGLAGIGMGIMHDANHGAYSSNPAVNKVLGFVLNLVGGDSQNWIIQHNILHHTYTNIHDHDEDIDDKIIMRFSPHGKYKSIQRFQILYVFFFYSIMTLYWTTVKDFFQYARYIRKGHNKADKKQQVKTWFSMSFWKAVYLTYILIVPIFFLKMLWWKVLLGFLLLHAVAGLVLSIVFQLAHVVEKTSFPHPDEKGTIQNEWAIHQLETTADFGGSNPIITFYVGGLNYQAIHHLFPRICHVHYPKIAPIVAQTAKEFGVPYHHYPSMASALGSHLRLLVKLGHPTPSAAAILNNMG